ncbi:hypothetical protein LXT21_11745 [Myxococcus sp. K38C18041901]|uniref:hypothetical protein n=1 Tax=Myxococcus guangdongensis TaxID=2906760 RepID=UPI0020A7B5EB|nr:hypothetical protein [Myxococcus guangdongensis]MCP3059449.1 hypothetical protein [Myxococcus guangdongensis]
MQQRSFFSILAMASLFVCLSSTEVLAQNAQGGTANHGTYITVPSGTVNDWVLLVSPREMGFEEPGSEADNALLKLECFVIPINAYTWQVVARYKLRPWSTRDGVWNAGSANYILVHR